MNDACSEVKVVKAGVSRACMSRYKPNLHPANLKSLTVPPSNLRRRLMRQGCPGSIPCLQRGRDDLRVVRTAAARTLARQLLSHARCSATCAVISSVSPATHATALGLRRFVLWSFLQRECLSFSWHPLRLAQQPDPTTCRPRHNPQERLRH